jgi:hypothetical protein
MLPPTSEVPADWLLTYTVEAANSWMSSGQSEADDGICRTQQMMSLSRQSTTSKNVQNIHIYQLHCSFQQCPAQN